MSSLRSIIRLFRKGNVLVCGLRGSGKDMLLSNVVVRRKQMYVSNVNYDGTSGMYWIPFVPRDFDVKSTYVDFIDGTVLPYKYPFPDGTDIYISDAGVYFPSQYCGDLNKRYGGFISFYALSRHLGACNVHCNVQNLNRLWDKLREQSDIYIRCIRCIVIGRLVFQTVMIYENYDACLNRVPLFPIRRPLLNRDRKMSWDLAYSAYRVQHGKIVKKRLIYINKSSYDTRAFRSILDPTSGSVPVPPS